MICGSRDDRAGSSGKRWADEKEMRGGMCAEASNRGGESVYLWVCRSVEEVVGVGERGEGVYLWVCRSVEQ